MKIKTLELTGVALDWAVAKCKGFTELRKNPHRFAYENELIMTPPRAAYGPVLLCDYAYSTDWAQGGPIIEREKINVAMEREGLWVAQIHVEPYHRRVVYTASADTPIVAAMRCYVRSKLGDEVEMPEGVNHV